PELRALRRPADRARAAEPHAAACCRRREHPGAAGRYALRHRQTPRRVDLGHGASIKPGQQLLLPAGALPPSAAPPANRTPVVAAKTPPPAAPAPMTK